MIVSGVPYISHNFFWYCFYYFFEGLFTHNCLYITYFTIGYYSNYFSLQNVYSLRRGVGSHFLYFLYSINTYHITNLTLHNKYIPILMTLLILHNMLCNSMYCVVCVGLGYLGQPNYSDLFLFI